MVILLKMKSGKIFDLYSFVYLIFHHRKIDFASESAIHVCFKKAVSTPAMSCFRNKNKDCSAHPMFHTPFAFFCCCFLFFPQCAKAPFC